MEKLLKQAWMPVAKLSNQKEHLQQRKVSLILESVVPLSRVLPDGCQDRGLCDLNSFKTWEPSSSGVRAGSQSAVSSTG